MSLFRANSARPAVAGIPVKYWPYITRHTIKYFYIANIIKYCPIALGLGEFFGGICFSTLWKMWEFVQLDLFYDHPQFFVLAISRLSKSCKHKHWIFYAVVNVNFYDDAIPSLYQYDNYIWLQSAPRLCDIYFASISKCSIPLRVIVIFYKNGGDRPVNFFIRCQRRERCKKYEVSASIYMSNISHVHLAIHTSVIYCHCWKQKIWKQLPFLKFD